MELFKLSQGVWVGALVTGFTEHAHTLGHVATTQLPIPSLVDITWSLDYHIRVSRREKNGYYFNIFLRFLSLVVLESTERENTAATI